MDRMLLDLAEGGKSSIWLILLICFILYAWTTFVCYLPLWISCSQTALSIVSAIGAGLMVGAAFTVVIPESINDALADMGGLETPEAALSAYRLIGICVTVGFGFMMVVDALTHSCCGHHHDHEHGKEGVEEPLEVALLENLQEEKHSEEHHEEKHEHNDYKHGHSYQATVWGLCFHSIFDGVAIGATMLDQNPRVLWVILAAIVLHKTAAAFGLGAYFKKLGLNVKKCTYCVLVCNP